jgi:negative modulator of initiation of replication
MKTIDIDEDINAYLLKHISEFGESPSQVLRRLLGLGAGTSPTTSLPGNSGAASSPVADISDLNKMLASSEFTYARGVVGRFLVALRWLHERDPEGFRKVESIQGRGRLYFAKNPGTLKEAGKSVNPKEITGTPYWVITTTPTNLKQEILERVMQALGYGLADLRALTEAIAR